jgi:hypothetical protein
VNVVGSQAGGRNRTLRRRNDDIEYGGTCLYLRLINQAHSKNGSYSLATFGGAAGLKAPSFLLVSRGRSCNHGRARFGDNPVFLYA